MSTLDEAYTAADHQFRDKDRYAQAKYKLTARWLSRRMRPGKRLINVGCGYGYFNAVATSCGLDVIACEPDESTYKIAAETAGKHCTVLNGSLADLAAYEGTADIIVMHDVLEHIDDDAAACAMLRRLLKNDGAAVISVPALKALFGYHDVRLGHYRRYSRSTLSAVLARQFVVDRLQYYGFFSIPIVLYFSKLRRAPYPIGTASSGMINELYGWLCDAETNWRPPLGTSLLALVRPLP